MTNGSSPPVRGTLPWRRRRRLRRFIPACAGNTLMTPQCLCPMPVHPRLCGEHLVMSSVDAWMDGSSPPVRGTRLLDQELRSKLRFIPACAGNTTLRRTLSASPPVHPRLCGEHPLRVKGGIHCRGSSPPVRGTPCRAKETQAMFRFIPACAGNTRRPGKSVRA